LRWPRDTLYPLKLALTLPTSGGRSVGIVRLQTKATEFVLLFCFLYWLEGPVFFVFYKNKIDWFPLNKTAKYYYYCSTALFWALAAFTVSCSYTQSVGLLGRGISPFQGLYLHTEQYKHKINANNADIHALWDSNPLSQRSRKRRQFMP
jgi:hypothetical protein